MPMASSKRSILGERETVNVAPTPVLDEDIAAPERNREVSDMFRMTVPVNLLGLPAAVVMAFRKLCKLSAPRSTKRVAWRQPGPSNSEWKR